MKKSFSYRDYTVVIEGPVRDAFQGEVLKVMEVKKTPKGTKNCPCKRGVGIRYLWILLDNVDLVKVPPAKYRTEYARLDRLANQKVSQLETKVKAAIDEHLQRGHKT